MSSMGKRLVNHCHKQNTIGYDENIDFIDTEEHMKTVIIGIAGGTGSGKSTFTNRLKDEFKDQVAVLYHDNYYPPRTIFHLRSARRSIMIIQMLLRQNFSSNISNS